MRGFSPVLTKLCFAPAGTTTRSPCATFLVLPETRASPVPLTKVRIWSVSSCTSSPISPPGGIVMITSWVFVPVQRTRRKSGLFSASVAMVQFRTPAMAADYPAIARTTPPTAGRVASAALEQPGEHGRGHLGVVAQALGLPALDPGEHELVDAADGGHQQRPADRPHLPGPAPVQLVGGLLEEVDVLVHHVAAQGPGRRGGGLDLDQRRPGQRRTCSQHLEVGGHP